VKLVKNWRGEKNRLFLWVKKFKKKFGSSQFFGKYALRHSSPQAKASGYL
jgi:hypothetical protein